MPLVIPTEAILMFCGYLASAGFFNIYTLFIVSVLADLSGTSLWYFIFFFFGKKIKKRYSKVFPGIFNKLDKAGKVIEQKGLWGTFIIRLTPFIRGHASLLSGLLGIPYKKMAPIILAASFVWVGALLGAGYVLGDHWRVV